MSDKPKMKLSEQASGILRDLCFSRMKVLRAGDISSVDELPKHTELGEFAARQSLLVFDFFRSAMAGHEEAVKRQSLVQKIIELAAEMEDTGAWIVKAFLGDYPENTKTVEIAGLGKWKIDFPSQLYAFLKAKKENLISDQYAEWVKPNVNVDRGENNAATDHRTERPADVAGETGGAGEPRQHGISDTGDPGEYKAGLEIPNYAVDTDESSDWREGLQTL